MQIQHASESSNQWLHYIAAVKNVLKAARRCSQGSFDTDPDMVSLLYWVSYHDVLAQFSLSYWKHPRPAKDSKEIDILVQKNMELEACHSLPPHISFTYQEQTGFRSPIVLSWNVKNCLGSFPSHRRTARRSIPPSEEQEPPHRSRMEDQEDPPLYTRARYSWYMASRYRRFLDQHSVPTSSSRLS